VSSGLAAGIARADVLVLGASYLGAEVVHLLRRRAPGLSVTVVDRQRNHGYIPLVHERLVGRLDWSSSVLRTAEFVERKGARFVHAEVASLDPRAKEVALADGRRLRARFVVVALGSVTSPPDTLPGRAYLLGHKLEAETDAARAAVLHVLGPEGPPEPRAVVVGAGISGVELAAELAHLARARPHGWRAPRVTLIDAGPRVVPHLSQRASAAVQARLLRQGVVLRLGTLVVAAERGMVRVRGPHGKHDSLPADLAFWCGGVRPAPVLGSLGLPRTRSGFLRVSPELLCEPFGPDVMAGGDCARVVDEARAEWPTMQRTIEALWAADTISDNIARLAKEKPGYPRGVPRLRRHGLRPDFFHGLSIGRDSLVVRGDSVLDLGPLNVAFRRFLMWGYFRRYAQWT
jgi:NADH dehydrogenase